MKDMFEEKLHNRLQQLEQEAGIEDMLNRDAIWTRIEAAQQPVLKRSWRPTFIRLAAAVICCLGIGLLIQFQQQHTGTEQRPMAVTVAPSIPAPTVATAGKEVFITKEKTIPLSEKMVRKPQKPQTNVLALPKEQGLVNNNHVPADHKSPGIITGQPVNPQPAEVPQLAVMYLSDLDKEHPATVMPQKSREPGRVARYVKSNLEEYAAALPPRVIINQILSK